MKYISIENQYGYLTKDKTNRDVDAAFYGKFIDELAKSGKFLSGKKRLYSEDIKGYQLTSIDKMPAKGKPGIYGLSNIAASDDLRPNYNGVFVDNGLLVATDAHKLVIIKDTENVSKKWNGQIIGVRTKDLNRKYEGTYPNWRSVMPTADKAKDKATVNIEDILQQVNGRVMILKNFSDVNYIILKIKGNKIGVKHEFLLDLLNSLRANGAKKVTVYFYDAHRALLFETDNGNKAIIMPMLVNDIDKRDDFMVKPLQIN